MKKIYMIYVFLLIFLISVTYAIEVDDPDLLLFLDMDDSAEPVIDSKNNAHANVNFGSSGDGVTFQSTAISPHTDYSIAFAGSSDFLINTTQIDTLIYGASGTDGFTWGAWAFPTSFDGDDDILAGRQDTGEGWSLGVSSDGGNTAVCKWNYGAGEVTVTTLFAPYGKSLLLCKVNATGISIYENGTQKAYQTSVTTGEPAGVGMTVGARQGTATKDFTGTIDDVVVFNRSLSDIEILSLYDDGFEGIIPILATPTIEPPSPADDTTSNSNQTLNVSHSTEANDIRYYLYFGDTSTLTEGHLYLDNVTRNASEWRSFYTNVSDGTYYWKWQVQNISNGVFSENTTQRTWSLDTTIPTITLNPDNSFDTDSISRINQYANYLFLNVTFEDETELFGVQINITKGGISYFNYTNVSFGAGIGNQTFNFTQNISTSLWPNGVYEINLTASDSHTAQSIDNYDVSNGIRSITFNTPENNIIEISSDGSSYSTLYNKKKDKYEFGWDYLFTDSTRKFTLKSNNKIYYLPTSRYTAHFVILGNGLNGNWVDFEGIGKDYSVKKIKENEYEITFINLPLTNTIISKSLGGINKVSEMYLWYKGNYTATSPISSTFGNIETFSLNISRNNTFARPNVTFVYDNVEYFPSSTFNEHYTIFSRDLEIPNPSSISNIINFTWVVNITQSDNSLYTFNISSSINISQSLLDNCSVYNTTILRISGKDEETDEDVNTTLNIVFIPQNGFNNSYELSGKINYTFCTNSDINYTLDSIMEYGNGIDYTDRKYYLNNFQIDISTIADVYLYHLNDSKASEIVFTVFDTTTGDRVSEAFIKILRYYPGENVYRIVEIAKTDEVGQTLGKMVLADVFYKFIIESPAGTVKLDTDVLRILSLTRTFGITFVEDYLDTWNKIYGVSYSLTCTKGTQTCRITWSDTSNIVQDVTLEVWRMTGLADQLLFRQTTVAAAGTLSYTVTEDTATNRYVAKGFIESSTGASTYPTNWASFFYSDNPFFTDSTHRLASLFPLLLLVICIIFALIDFGTIGVVIGSMIGLTIGSVVGILPLSPFYFVSFLIMGIILIYKLNK